MRDRVSAKPISGARFPSEPTTSAASISKRSPRLFWTRFSYERRDSVTHRPLIEIVSITRLRPDVKDSVKYRKDERFTLFDFN